MPSRSCLVTLTDSRGIPYLDVYVATSMREEKHFLDHAEFVQQVFSDPSVSHLKLRYFDPTLSFVDDRITKGLIECLMLRRAKVTIYNAGESDSLGKDSELAATLAQGKPVIAYVPEASRVITSESFSASLVLRSRRECCSPHSSEARSSRR